MKPQIGSITSQDTAQEKRAGQAPVLHVPTVQLINNRNRLVITVALCSLVLALVVAGGVWSLMTEAATTPNFANVNKAPTLSYIFGTDWLGHDMLARTLAGITTSLFVGLVASVVSACFAVILGALAALGGPRTDACIAFAIDVMMGVPHIILLILISLALGKGMIGVTLGVALTHWPRLARVIRAELLQVRSQPYLGISRALGVSRLNIFLTHLLPCIVPQIMVGIILMFPHAILHEASLTFLGFGLNPSQPAIGIILKESLAYLSTGMWWLAFFPGMALMLCILLFDRVGTSLRVLVNPASSQR